MSLFFLHGDWERVESGKHSIRYTFSQKKSKKMVTMQWLYPTMFNYFIEWIH